MKVVRQITYESENQETLDQALANSRPDGITASSKIGRGITMTIRTFVDERNKGEQVSEPEAQPTTFCNCATCIKVRQDREMAEHEQDARGGM